MEGQEVDLSEKEFEFKTLGFDRIQPQFEHVCMFVFLHVCVCVYVPRVSSTGCVGTLTA